MIDCPSYPPPSVPPPFRYDLLLLLWLLVWLFSKVQKFNTKKEKQRLNVLTQFEILLLAWSADHVSWIQTLTHTHTHTDTHTHTCTLRHQFWETPTDRKQGPIHLNPVTDSRIRLRYAIGFTKPQNQIIEMIVGNQNGSVGRPNFDTLPLLPFPRSSFFLAFSTSLSAFHLARNLSASATSSVMITLSKMVLPFTCSSAVSETHREKPQLANAFVLLGSIELWESLLTYQHLENIWEVISNHALLRYLFAICSTCHRSNPMKPKSSYLYRLSSSSNGSIVQSTGTLLQKEWRVECEYDKLWAMPKHCKSGSGRLTGTNRDHKKNAWLCWVYACPKINYKPKCQQYSSNWRGKFIACSYCTDPHCHDPGKNGTPYKNRWPSNPWSVGELGKLLALPHTKSPQTRDWQSSWPPTLPCKLG